jgi:hypothetical protein
MTGRAQRPPSGEPWIWLTRELVASPAWQSLGINARRFIDFLMIEHMRQGGRRNGFLLAPWRQLYAFGIGAHFVNAAIEETERAGLVDCKRGIGRRPSTYSLTWLTLSDGSDATNRWRTYAVATAKEQSLQMHAVSTLTACQTACTKPVATAKEHAQSPVSLHAKQQSPSIKDLTKAKAKDGPRPNGVVVGDPQPADPYLVSPTRRVRP